MKKDRESALKSIDDDRMTKGLEQAKLAAEKDEAKKAARQKSIYETAQQQQLQALAKRNAEMHEKEHLKEYYANQHTLQNEEMKKAMISKKGMKKELAIRFQADLEECIRGKKEVCKCKMFTAASCVP